MSDIKQTVENSLHTPPLASPHELARSNNLLRSDEFTSVSLQLHPLSPTMVASTVTRLSPRYGQSQQPTSPLACNVPVSIMHSTSPSHSSMSLIQHTQPQQQISGILTCYSF